jgi:23S rRNA (cytidine1920-2'-O)/16S rRNA (cytidine1409-2'-O)-methyltransferase
MIMAGKVLVDLKPVDKPGTRVPEDVQISLRGEDIPYVSRGGLKLKGALQAFSTDVKGLTCLDIGASTGGFTDCLLQNGALKVYAVDVGYGQLAWKLRQDARVTIFERTNIRHLQQHTIPELVDLATIDVSFISLKLVVPVTLKFMKPGSQIIALIKPQFEVGKEKIGKGGIVRDKALHQEVINNLQAFFGSHHLLVSAVVPSPIKGPKGNQEFFVLLHLPTE